jgi:hypothetical protein
MKAMTPAEMGKKGGQSRSAKKLAAIARNLRKANARKKELTRAKRLA